MEGDERKPSGREQFAAAKGFRAASPQSGSWRQPAQGKCSFPCDDWQEPERFGQSSAFRRKPPAGRNTLPSGGE